MIEWHHPLSGHEFEQTPGDGEGRGSLACCSPWRRKESDTTEPLNHSSGLPGLSWTTSFISSSQESSEVGVIFMPILQKGKQRLREVK